MNTNSRLPIKDKSVARMWNDCSDLRIHEPAVIEADIQQVEYDALRGVLKVAHSYNNKGFTGEIEQNT